MKIIFAIGVLIALFMNFSPMISVLVGIGVAIYVMFKYPVFSALVGLSFLIGEG